MARRQGKSANVASGGGNPRAMARIAAMSSATTPASSGQTTPMSSAYPSTYSSEIETDDEAARIPIASLTLDTPLIPFSRPRRVPSQPFPFLSLPSELRIKIYAYYFQGSEDVLDLGPGNYKRYHKQLGLMRVSKQVHDEATHLFYSTQTFRLFPTYPGRYFKSKKPLLARLKPNQRESITSLELRLGPGWNAPPKGWVVNDALGLQDCADVQRLNVFVECDPSDKFYEGFRRAEGYYEGFSCRLMNSVLEALPAVETIEFDAWPGVKRSGAMMQSLMRTAVEAEMHVAWGPCRGWTDSPGEDDKINGHASPFVDADGVSMGEITSQNILIAA